MVAAVCTAAYLALTVLVLAHLTQGFDDAARELFRPGDEWGTAQRRADLVVEGLKPRNVAPLLAGVGIGASLYRRSWRPVAFGGLLGGVAVALTVATKVALSRPDTHGEVTWTGGSYPSGHTVAVLVASGGALLILRERRRWWEWVCVALVGCGMGLALLLQAAHWFTDVAGGLLLATAVLATATVTPLRPAAPRTATGTAHRGPPRAS